MRGALSTPRGRLALAVGTPRWVWPCAGGGILAAILGARLNGRARGSALLVAAAAGAIVAFFRDPERAPAEGALLAPADGVISAVERLPDGRTRVATFMRLYDVHVNRAPAAGVVHELTHHPGGYRPAFRKDSASNERMVWLIQSALGELELVQIAGLAARRIVPYRSVGESVAQGERIGMIRFGSRVDVFMPAGTEPTIRVGDRVHAGRTRLDLP